MLLVLRLFLILLIATVMDKQRVYHFSQTAKGLDWCNSNVESAFIAGQKDAINFGKGLILQSYVAFFYFST